MAILGRLKIKLFWNKGYDVIIYPSRHQKNLSRASNYIVDLVMWPEFGNLAFLWQKLSQPQFYKDLTRKITFFDALSWFKFSNLGLTLGMTLIGMAPILNRVNVKPMKWSEGKQLAGYIFAHCIALAPNLPLLAGFAEHVPLVVFLCLEKQVWREKVLGIQLYLAPAQDSPQISG